VLSVMVIAWPKGVSVSEKSMHEFRKVGGKIKMERKNIGWYHRSYPQLQKS